MHDTNLGNYCPSHAWSGLPTSAKPKNQNQNKNGQQELATVVDWPHGQKKYWFAGG